MQLTPEEQTRLDELEQKWESKGPSEMEPNELAQTLHLLNKQGYEEEGKATTLIASKAKRQLTLLTDKEMDRYRRPGTVQRRLFDSVQESGV